MSLGTRRLRNARSGLCCFSLWAIGASLTGCGGGTTSVSQMDGRSSNGVTYYLDGAGNWGFGVGDVPRGLKKAGYKGNVEVFIWTSSFNPAIDQVNRLGNELRAAVLAGKITNYLKKNPGADVNIIALSAGTGVATWAVEKLKPPYKVNNLILLGSSLSYDYDMRKALANMKGNVYVYYSRYDSILEGPVRALGTVDGKLGHDAAGLVGLRSPGGRGRIINTGWNRKYQKFGWSGSHTDCTSELFIRTVVARHVVGPKTDTHASDMPTTQPAVKRSFPDRPPAPPTRLIASASAARRFDPAALPAFPDQDRPTLR